MPLYGAAEKALNLSDLASSSSARTNLGLGTEASAAVSRTAAVGTAGTNVTAVEYSADGLNYTTILTLAAVAVTIGDAAALANGAAIYTFPAAAIIIHGASMSVGITADDAAAAADTPELGIGTTVGSGVNATLGDVGAAAENVLGPAVANNCTGTAELSTRAPGKTIEAAGGKVIYFNYADTWANVTVTTGTLDGTVVLGWSILPLA